MNQNENIRPLYPAGVEETDEEKKKYPDDDVWPPDRQFEEDNDKDKDINITPLYPNGVEPK
jgi:hypothetical protein